MIKSIFRFKSEAQKFVLFTFALALVISGCTPEGVINKTKYEGEKITNTCETFQEEIQQIISSNSTPSQLVVAEYDNSEFGYYYLDPGQFEIKDGMLNFRFAQDLEYGKYLYKGVAIHVVASYSSVEHLAMIESPNGGEIGTLVVDEEYYNSHKDPFFMYSIPITEDVNGKQITLSFSVVKYKKGEIKKIFCNSVEVPLGPITPSCCSYEPWDGNAESIVEMPDLEIPDEKYKYRGFTGTLDVIFPENSTKFDKNLISTAIQDYVRRYESLGYKVTSINLEGWASLGGKEEYNQKLSEKRAKAVYDDLVTGMENPELNIDFKGMGEDWNRLSLLTKTSVLSSEEQGQVLAIVNGAGTNDEKEAEMRKLEFWEKLVDEVIVNTRHTFVTFSFDYQPDKMWVEYYPSQMPVISDELLNLATQSQTVSRWKSGEDTKKGLKVLDILLGNNKKPNLFAMRSTYHFGRSDFNQAIKDIEQALSYEKGNMAYALASLAYKTKFADTYSMEDRMGMLDMYNDYVEQYPNNRSLFLNRAVMMDKAGYVSGALKEYSDLMEGTTATASNLNNRGVAKLKTNRLTEAEADFKAALEADPKLAEASFNLAVIYALRGLSSKAIENLATAVQNDSKIKEKIYSNDAFKVIKGTSQFDQFK